eukprot:jgi/Mesvir1/24667/Mv21961-RA.1
MFRDSSAEDGTEWTCQECGGPWPPTAISKEASPVDFKEKVVDAQLAGLGALYSLGGKGKVVKVPSRKLVKLAKVVDGRVDDGLPALQEVTNVHGRGKRIVSKQPAKEAAATKPVKRQRRSENGSAPACQAA